MARELPGLVPAGPVLIVADERTWEVAGDRLHAALGRICPVSRCVLRDPPGGQLHGTTELVEELDASQDRAHASYVAVGSGTVNDLTRALAHRRRQPYAVLATAASMNGYTSAIVALIDDGLKTTRPATPPVAVFADPQVLAAAPSELTLAGLGDLVSKPYCGCDFKLAARIRDEYHCPLPDQLLAGPFARLLEELPRFGVDSREGVRLLFQLLLISGLSMAVTGTSAPASGAEHLLSHYWDMIHLRDRRPLGLHGAQVGVASLVIDELYRRVLDCDFSSAGFLPTPALAAEEARINATFGTLAPAVWPQWRTKLEGRSERDLRRLCAHQADIKAEISHTLEVGTAVRRVLSESGAPTSVQDIGLTREDLAAAVLNGRTIRDRYTILDVAAELGQLEGFANDLITPAEARH
jgi:glycerol-1-phosphate dehydrogenase [NAD(P)+]